MEQVKALVNKVAANPYILAAVAGLAGLALFGKKKRTVRRRRTKKASPKRRRK